MVISAAADYCSFIYKSADQLEESPYTGYLATYEGGGFNVQLPMNKISAQQVIQSLISHNWIDRATRAVFLGFETYNANVDLFGSVRYSSFEIQN